MTEIKLVEQPTGKELEYRIIAVNKAADDSDIGTDGLFPGAEDSQNPLMTGGSQWTTHYAERMNHSEQRQTPSPNG